MNDYKITDSFDSPAKIILRQGFTEEDLYPVKSFGRKMRDAFSKQGVKNFFIESFPQRKDSAKEKIRKIIMDISFVLFICTLVYLIVYYGNYRTHVHDSNEIIAIMDRYSGLEGRELEKAWNDIRKQYPQVDFPDGMDISFAELYAVNSDIAGRLSVPGTNINTVFMQTTNNSYYLYKDFYGNQSRYGMPFAGYSCNMGKDGLSKNTIMYGHNTHDGLMFHQLIKYMDIEGYRASPVINLDTLYGSYKWKVFGVILTNATSDLDNGNVFNCLYSEYTSDEAFMSVIKGIQKRSMINTGIDVNENDKIISLYTCYQDIFKGGRLIVFGRLLREGESEQVDTSKAYFNNSALYPQAYYDALGLSNPYYTAKKTSPEPSSSVSGYGYEMNEENNGEDTGYPAVENSEQYYEEESQDALTGEEITDNTEAPDDFTEG